MKKHYILLLITMFLTGIVNAQIVQVTDLNAAGNSDIASPFLYQGAIYFEGDNGDGLTGDELYRIASDGTVALFKNINVDPADGTPNSDPGNFIEYNGKMYFNANDGDNTGTDKELWVSDGTPENTMLVYDIRPGVNLGSNPQQMFVFNNRLYFQANDGTSTQWWRYDGTGIPIKITNLNGGGFATPIFPIVDTANNIVYFQASNGKNELHVLKADETVDIIDINAADHGYIGSQSILFNGKLYFQGDGGTNGDELWVSDGTIGGTSMVKDINTTPGANSDPASFAIYNDKLYFVANPGTGNQLWVTDGTPGGTMMAAEPVTGGEGLLDDLYAYNGKLYFSATDGINGVELWVYDGITASMLKDLNAAGNGNPAGFAEVDGLLFFEATDGISIKLWVSDGTPDRTMTVASAFGSGPDPLDVDAAEFVIKGTVLYFTGDDAFGDDIFSADAHKIYSYDVTFTVTDGVSPLEGADVTFNGITTATLADGTALFEDVRVANDLPYSVNLVDYIEATGTVNVIDTAVNEDVVLTLIPKYNVTFNVTDGTDPLEGATVTFSGQSMDTDISGVAVFAGIEAGTGLAYTVSKTGYSNAAGTIDVVDADVIENVTINMLFYIVTFNVSDGVNPLEGAEVSFNSEVQTTDASGAAVFTGVAVANGLAYTVTKEGYEDALGSLDVVDGDVDQGVSLILIVYTVNFTISDGANPIDGASVSFNSEIMTSDASGLASFDGVVPGTGLAYSVTKAGYDDVNGTLDVVDADVNENVTMNLILYTVTFNVTDGSAALEGAMVSFNSIQVSTNSSGTALFTDVAPGTGLAYTVNLLNFFIEAGTVDVDGDETVDIVMTATGISGQNVLKVKVYPNPAIGSVTVEGAMLNSKYSIYDINQRMVKSGNLKSQVLELDLTPGIYFLHLESDGKKSITRLVMMR